MAGGLGRRNYSYCVWGEKEKAGGCRLFFIFYSFINPTITPSQLGGGRAILIPNITGFQKFKLDKDVQSLLFVIPVLHVRQACHQFIWYQVSLRHGFYVVYRDFCVTSFSTLPT